MRRAMPCLLLTLFLIVVEMPGTGRSFGDEAQPVQKAGLRFALPDGPAGVWYATVVEAAKDGTIRLRHSGLGSGRPSEPVVTEGYYLAFAGADVRRSPKDARLVRVRVKEVLKDGAVAEVGKGALEHVNNSRGTLILFRPSGSTTKELQRAPEVAQIVDAITGMNPRQAPRLAQSQINLKQIGIALHNYHDVHRQFPPAVIYGPDGKPWHSWRVLILPFIEQNKLYEQYKFDEPWNGPNNKKLLSKMPKVYRDPIHDEEEEEGYYTNYVAVTGKNAAFPAEGAKFDGKKLGAVIGTGRGATSIRDFTDGTSNTVIVGTVGPERGIEWSRPEDIVIDEKIPGIGEKGGFSAPYEGTAGRAGVFLRCDGSVQTILADVEKETFRRLLIRNDGMPVGEVPGIDPRSGEPPGKRRVPVLRIIEGPNGPQARLEVELVDREDGGAKTAVPQRRPVTRPAPPRR